MAEDQIAVRKEVSGAKGRFTATVSGAAEAAELTVSIANPSLVIADHTGVPESLRGRGLAGRLAAALVEDARAEGYKIMALCPFVQAERRKHPEWTDAFVG